LELTGNCQKQNFAQSVDNLILVVNVTTSHLQKTKLNFLVGTKRNKMGKKLTAEEIGQHVIDNPSTGFDQCSQCQGIEAQGAMKDLDESKPFDDVLICDECAAVANQCSNCDFDMGQGYENCGGAGDGVCPECGQDDGKAVPQKVQVTAYDDGDGVEWKLMFGDETVEDGFQSTADAEMWARDNGYIPMSQEPEAYEVSVCRTGYGFHRIQVQARSPEEAEELALDEAGDHEYSEKSSEYTTDGVTRL
jgi:hypothetical protein